MKTLIYLFIILTVSVLSCTNRSIKSNHLIKERKGEIIKRIDTAEIKNSALKTIVKNVTSQDLPYFETKDKVFWFPSKYDNLPKEFRDNLPISINFDITGNNPEKQDNYCVILRQFDQTNGDYLIFELRVGANEISKEMLVTYDFNGKPIDYLISNYGYYMQNPMCRIQSELSKDLSIKKYELKFSSSTPVLYTDKFDKILGQRFDYLYKISSEGKFLLVETTTYKEKNYTYDEIISSTNIRDGNEVILK